MCCFIFNIQNLKTIFQNFKTEKYSGCLIFATDFKVKCGERCVKFPWLIKGRYWTSMEETEVNESFHKEGGVAFGHWRQLVHRGICAPVTWDSNKHKLAIVYLLNRRKFKSWLACRKILQVVKNFHARILSAMVMSGPTYFSRLWPLLLSYHQSLSLSSSGAKLTLFLSESVLTPCTAEGM